MKKDTSLDTMDAGLENGPKHALQRVLRKLALQRMFTAETYASLVRGERVEVNLCGMAALMHVDWLQCSGKCPVLEVRKPLAGDSGLCPAKGTALVAVGFACRDGKAYELLGLAWQHAVPGREPVSIVLDAYGDDRRVISFASLVEALSAGVRMLKQASGGLVADALASDRLPTVLPECPPTVSAGPNDDSAGTGEEVIP